MTQISILIRKNRILYLLTILAYLAMRYLNRITDSDALLWILAPTTRWAGILGGIPFEYLSHEGYVNHYYRFLIAPSCSGIRFMSIVFLMLIFSFVHRIPSVRSKCLWFSGSAVFAYLSTIFVNGIRIVTAIYLPIPLERAGLLNGWLNPDRLHTLIGTVIYFSSLCAIYPIALSLCSHPLLKASAPYTDDSPWRPAEKLRLLIPAFWYLLAVLIIPFAGRVLHNNWEHFDSYAVLITGTCLILLAVFSLIRRIFRSSAQN